MKTNLLLAAEAVVEAHFAQVRFAMIGEIIRASGFGEHKANLLENELRRVTQAAIPLVESSEKSEAASQRAAEDVLLFESCANGNFDCS